jgi:hypothetical protein
VKKEWKKVGEVGKNFHIKKNDFFEEKNILNKLLQWKTRILLLTTLNITFSNSLTSINL